MAEQLRILINEDMHSDAELLEYEIRRGGFSIISRRVETREEYLAALEEFAPDLIISDYNLPSFD
ncbi:MAG TPA: response regulator, partial [Geobacteraceae bacterium]|nr:response regulator [Geobacteraceae bacterium]